MTHEGHHLWHREHHSALAALVEDWMAHHLCAHADAIGVPINVGEAETLTRALLDRPIRDLVAWSSAQTVNPVPLPDELHVAVSSAAPEPCDAECGARFGAGHERCRHLRTPEESLRTR